MENPTAVTAARASQKLWPNPGINFYAAAELNKMTRAPHASRAPHNMCNILDALLRFIQSSYCINLKFFRKAFNKKKYFINFLFSFQPFNLFLFAKNLGEFLDCSDKKGGERIGLISSIK